MYKYLIKDSKYTLDENFSGAGKTKTFESFFNDFHIETENEYIKVAAIKNFIGIEASYAKVLIDVSDPENISLLSNKKCLYYKDWSDKRDQIFYAFKAACSIKHKAAALAFLNKYIWNAQNDNFGQSNIKISEFKFENGISNQLDNFTIYEDIKTFLENVYNPALYESALKAIARYDYYKPQDRYLMLNRITGKVTADFKDYVIRDYQRQAVKKCIEENFIDY